MKQTKTIFSLMLRGAALAVLATVTAAATWAQTTPTVTAGQNVTKVTVGSSTTEVTTTGQPVPAAAGSTVKITASKPEAGKVARLKLTRAEAAVPKVPVTKITVSEAPEAQNRVNTMWKMIATVEPENATDKSVTWTIDDGDGTIATINTVTGVVTATGPGQITVRATANDGSGVTGSMIVAVEDNAVKGITVSGAGGATTVMEGGTLQMSAEVSPEWAVNKAVTWSVLDLDESGEKTTGTTNYASIDEAGLLRGNNYGKVRVFASANDHSGTTGWKDIEVNDGSGQSTVDPGTGGTGIAPVNLENMTVSAVGGKATMYVGIQLPLEARNKNGIRVFPTWAKSKWMGNGEAPTIDPSTGIITAGSGTGILIVYARATGYNLAYYTVSVIARGDDFKAVEGINVYHPYDNDSFQSGSAVQMRAGFTPGDATYQNLLWSINFSERYFTAHPSINPYTGELYVGEGEGEITVTATALDGTDVSGDLTINVTPKQ